MKPTPLIFLSLFILASCSSNKKLAQKGFQVSHPAEQAQNNKVDGLMKDSLKFETKPSSVLLTGVANVRLTPIYKVNLRKDGKTTFTGSNSFHYNYEEHESYEGQAWHGHYLPGLEAVAGYNLVNVSHYDLRENKQTAFFEKPVLVKTIYYPAFEKDTLNHQPVSRDYFMVSVYNDDTNKDGFINLKDLRRFYLFDIHGQKQKALIPENYSVFQSEYDSANDLLHVFAQLDSNNNGSRDEGEAIHIFWIDLKNPARTGVHYKE